MPEIKRIILGVDFSEASDAATDYALELAESFGASVRVVHVLQRPLPLYGLDPMIGTHAAFNIENTVDRLERATRAVAHRLRQRGIDAEPTVLEGPAAREIVRCAAESDADVIVVGTVGHGARTGPVLGSVADRVLRTAPCPVITVGPEAARSETVEVYR